MSQNRLGRETSPYLLQHKDNPVHWWPWGPDALAEARATGRPILLSVGYAACHWCHVMAHESFEDADTAAVMNELFVNIKVDREERPDIDAIYMGALHRLGQHGGWPLTMFLGGDARPFWGGTYFPKTAQWGRPAFVDVLREVARIYRDEPEKIAANADAIVSNLQQSSPASAGPAINEALLAGLTERIVRLVDPVHGGIRGAPKFPQWSFFWLLWRGGIGFSSDAAKEAVHTTLRRICQGGIYDHLGGGFARYSVDERWLVPHFEKMLYDNALLIDLMTEVWRETGDPLLKTRIAETVDWLERDMVADGGAFASSLDADSEGEEGRFYVWSMDEIVQLLGAEDAAAFAAAYDVTAEGNWEGVNILNRIGRPELLPETEANRLARLRATLLSARSARIRPGWDDKVLADWNGLAIAALARASRVFERTDWLAAAQRAFDFVGHHMHRSSRLLHTYRGGRAHVTATAADYANMISAALRLHEVTLDDRYLETARQWVDLLDQHHWVVERGGYATTADDATDAIVRLCSAADDAVPNANATMVSNLVRLGLITAESRYHVRAEAILNAFAGELDRNPLGHSGLLAATFDVRAPQLVVVVASAQPGDARLAAMLNGVSLPGAAEYCLGATSPSRAAGLAGKAPVDGAAATAYVCHGPQCSAPVTKVNDFKLLLYHLRMLSQNASGHVA